MEEFIIRTRGVSKSYNKQPVVVNLNLEMPNGAVYGLLGANGAGKTTCMRLLLSLVAADAGSIYLFRDETHFGNRQALRRIGSVIETPTFYGFLSGYENLRVVQRLLDLPLNRIEAGLKTVGLLPNQHKSVKQYSLGMKQRLALARALLAEPELLLLDEPTNGLDPLAKEEMLVLLQAINRTQGTSILFSSHLLPEVEQIASHVGIMSAGTLVKQEKLSTLREMQQARTVFSISDPDRALALLQQLAYRASRSGKQGVDISHLDASGAAQVVKLLVEAGIEVYQVAAQPFSLLALYREQAGSLSRFQ